MDSAEDEDMNVVRTAQTDVEKQSAPSETDPSVQYNPRKKARRCTSEVWMYYTKVGRVEGKEKATCNRCGKSYVVGGKDYGTSTLWRHVKSCVPRSKYKDIGTMMLDQAMNVRVRQIDHNRVREMISVAIIKHDLPYSFVEYDGIKDVLKYLNPDYKHIARKAAVADVWNFYLGQKENLKKVIAKSLSRVCLTSNCWTSITSKRYICLTSHFVDENWKLNSKILAFSKMETPYSGVELAKKVHDILIDWKIDRKVFSITLEDASANDGQEGLKVTSEAIQKIRDSIKYVRQSEARLINFRKYVEEVGGIDTSLGLKLDVLTRWNSTHTMLENALTYRKAFFCLAFHDHDYHHYLTDEEWSLVDRTCKFLEPFAVMTMLISVWSYSTANMYFLQISKIESHLKEHAHSDDLVIRDLAVRMLDKFDKYCSDYSVILALATILDPRMKFDAIKFSYSNLDPIICNEKIENLRSKLYHVFSEYKDMGSLSSLVPSVGGESSSYVNVSMTLPPSSPHHTK